MEAWCNGMIISFDNSDQAPSDANNDAQGGSESEAKDDIFFLKFGRNPTILHNCLEEGPELKSCRDALEESGHHWNLQHGPYIFVHPSQYEQTMQFLSRDEYALRPYHVVVAESLQHLVEESLSGIPRSLGARIKNRITLGNAPQSKRARSTADGLVQQGAF